MTLANRNLELFDKNIKYLKGKFSEAEYKKLLDYECRLHKDIHIEAEYAKSGEVVFCVTKKDKDENVIESLYLNGIYDSSRSIRESLKRNKIGYSGKIILLGMESCASIRACLDSFSEGQLIIAYEPCLNIFVENLFYVDFSKLMDSKQVCFVVDQINDAEFTSIVRSGIRYEEIEHTLQYISPNYLRLFKDKIKEAERLVERGIKFTIVNENTGALYKDSATKSSIENAFFLYKMKNFFDLKNMLPSDVPTIVVSAGPSLDKNIEDLKKAKGKAFIIATDTALKACLKKGIIPDAYVIIDPEKPASIFEGIEYKKIPLFCSLHIPPEFVETHEGNVFFFLGTKAIELGVFKKICGEKNDGESFCVKSIVQGGSVAHAGFSAGIDMGSKVIILVGQDLAYTGKKIHVSGTKITEKVDGVDKDIEDLIDQKELYLVEDVHGGKVEAPADFILYREWFEGRISQLDEEYKVIDATEGGALIKGTEIMTLKQAIDKYCKREFPVKKMLAESPVMLNDNDRKIVDDYLLNLPEDFVKVSKKVLKAKGLYERLNEPNISKQELSRVSAELAKIVEYTENDTAALIVSESIADVLRELARSIYDEKDDLQENYRSIAENGIRIMEKMSEKALELEKFTRSVIEKRKQDIG